MIKAVIWDLDGTLLNTLGDLTDSVNYAMRQNGFAERTQEEVRAFVGNGTRKLMMRAVPDGEDNPLFAQACSDFLSYYKDHDSVRTVPYDGILTLLKELQRRGMESAVVSNKIDFAVRHLCSSYFGPLISLAVGDDPSRQRKPAPDSVFEAMRQLSVKPEDTVYIGDSDVDIQTAENAGVPGIGVTWGFRGRKVLEEAGASYIADTPEQILSCIEALNAEV